MCTVNSQYVREKRFIQNARNSERILRPEEKVHVPKD